MTKSTESGLDKVRRVKQGDVVCHKCTGAKIVFVGKHEDDGLFYGIFYDERRGIYQQETFEYYEVKL